jgi:hypothetical protein
MIRMTFVGALFAGACSLVLYAGAALGATPTFPACSAGQSGQTVSLVINTNGTSGWTANGNSAAALSNSANLWANASGAVSWIGPAAGTDNWGTPGTTASVGQYQYEVEFHLAGPASKHPQNMSLVAHWMADNCGLRLRAGSGSWVDIGGPVGVGGSSCYQQPSPNGKDFMYWSGANQHVTTATFAPSNSNQNNVRIKFRIANQPSTPTGIAGEFTVTGTCP